jgi:hypothetical protein
VGHGITDTPESAEGIDATKNTNALPAPRAPTVEPVQSCCELLVSFSAVLFAASRILQ